MYSAIVLYCSPLKRNSTAVVLSLVLATTAPLQPPPTSGSLSSISLGHLYTPLSLLVATLATLVTLGESPRVDTRPRDLGSLVGWTVAQLLYSQN